MRKFDYVQTHSLEEHDLNNLGEQGYELMETWLDEHGNRVYLMKREKDQVMADEDVMARLSEGAAHLASVLREGE